MLLVNQDISEFRKGSPGHSTGLNSMENRQDAALNHFKSKTCVSNYHLQNSEFFVCQILFRRIKSHFTSKFSV